MIKKKFFYNENEVLSSGILFYTIINSKKYILLRKDNKKNKECWSDIGGKCDFNDISIYDTISRESLEETDNKILNLLKLKDKEELKEWLVKSKSKIFYNKYCKYLLFKIELFNLDYKDIKVIHAENTVISWIHYNKKRKLILHPRLKRTYI